MKIDELCTQIKERSLTLCTHYYLESMRLGKVSSKEYKTFLLARLAVANGFEDLLVQGVRLALAQTSKLVAVELSSNLADERGITSDGEKHPLGSHTQWKLDFLKQLSLKKQDLETVSLDKGALEYVTVMNSLIKEDKLFELLGALLFLEWNIPEEFMILKKARDNLFSELFFVQEKDDTEICAAKNKARLYLDHHIVHDKESHFPDLVKALKTSSLNSEQIKSMHKGFLNVYFAKKAFYDDFS